MTRAGESPYIEVPVDCPDCRTNQVVHVLARAGGKQIKDQVISCAKCKEPFSVLVPDDIIDGPFVP